MVQQIPGETPVPNVTIAPSEAVQGYLDITGATLAPDPEALSALATRLKAPLPDEPNVRLLHERDFADNMSISYGRKVYDPGSPDLYVALPRKYMVAEEEALLHGTALALLHRKQGRQRRIGGRVGGALVSSGLAVSFAGGALDFQGHGWGAAIEKVGYGMFAAGGALIAYVYNRSEPTVPDLEGMSSPIRVS